MKNVALFSRNKEYYYVFHCEIFSFHATVKIIIACDFPNNLVISHYKLLKKFMELAQWKAKNCRFLYIEVRIPLMLIAVGTYHQHVTSVLTVFIEEYSENNKCPIF